MPPRRPLPKFQPAPQQQQGGALFKALDFLSRPSNASLAGLGEFVNLAQGEGGDPLGAAGRAFRGEETGGGRSFISALTNTPIEEFGAKSKVASTVADLLNPFDPLLFLGIGGLTKAGKAAKLGGRLEGVEGLAAGLGNQVRQGQRGLVTFAGQKVPLPGGGLALDGVEAAVQKVAKSKFGRESRRLFGGKRGAVLASVDPELEDMAKMVVNTDEGIMQVIRGFEASTAEDLRKLDALKSVEAEELGSLISRVNRKDMDINDAMVQFGGTGVRKKVRMDAFRAAQDVQPKLKQLSSTLDGTGLDQFLSDDLGFLPRFLDPLQEGTAITKGTKEFDDFLANDAIGNIIRPTAHSKNVLNKMLVQRSIQGITPELLDSGGRVAVKNMKFTTKEGRKLKGVQAFNAKMQKDPDAFKAFLEKHRLDFDGLDARLREMEVPAKVDRDAVRLIKEMQRQTISNVRSDSLIKALREQGKIVKWVDDVHGGPADPLGKYKWLKIDQGRYTSEPLAMSADVANVLDTTMSIMGPNAKLPMWAAGMAELIPKPIRDAGLLSWWKLAAIYKISPTSYWTRNVATGVFNNAIEGLSPNAFGAGLSRSQKMYSMGTELTGMWAAGNKGAGKTYMLEGVEWDAERLWQAYKNMNFHGGGLPDVDIITGSIKNKSAQARRNYFENTDIMFTGKQRTFDNKSGEVRFTLKTGQDASEHFLRIPLMLHYIEETTRAAKAAGLPVPRTVKALTKEQELDFLRGAQSSIDNYKYDPAGLGTKNINTKPATPALFQEDGADFIQASLENAREAVIRAHFDYTDLSPTEQALRGSFIPFYTWMRKNIPRQSVKMFTDFGAYMPFSRAYYRSFVNEEVDREDLPPWMDDMFVLPVFNTETDRVRVLDLNGFLPFMDVFELGSAALGKPRYGGTRANSSMRWAANQLNPFVQTPIEIATQTDLLSGRNVPGGAPREIFGLPANQLIKQGVDIIPQLSQLDRANPLGVFSKIGQATGTVSEDFRRENRNEPPGLARTARFFGGITFRDQDRNFFDRSPNQRRRMIGSLRGRVRRAGESGNFQLVRDLNRQIEELQGE